ncbi:hypothetical protein K504DRAFT_501922 [Pleomassaria siparia CBS 279.74]|uniref:Uncharacterized protein n=1 Tax=Pleomassaria siparia CBS 279.74 TaxID=1314801 RepID=A0A6G1K8G2_9PLEO|nr:hypothetical protein K504DRAFT_501922 [Pleomassaria siparia CBS 279.74]
MAVPRMNSNLGASRSGSSSPISFVITHIFTSTVTLSHRRTSEIALKNSRATKTSKSCRPQMLISPWSVLRFETVTPCLPPACLLCPQPIVTRLPHDTQTFTITIVDFGLRGMPGRNNGPVANLLAAQLAMDVLSCIQWVVAFQVLWGGCMDACLVVHFGPLNGEQVKKAQRPGCCGESDNRNLGSVL